MNNEVDNPWFFKLFQSPHEGTVDFASHQAEVDERAKNWSVYHARNYDYDMWVLLLQHQVTISELAKNAWDMEKQIFPTDDPQQQQSRFIETYVAATVEEAKDILQGPKNR